VTDNGRHPMAPPLRRAGRAVSLRQDDICSRRCSSPAAVTSRRGSVKEGNLVGDATRRHGRGRCRPRSIPPSRNISAKTGPSSTAPARSTSSSRRRMRCFAADVAVVVCERRARAGADPWSALQVPRRPQDPPYGVHQQRWTPRAPACATSRRAAGRLAAAAGASPGAAARRCRGRDLPAMSISSASAPTNTSRVSRPISSSCPTASGMPSGRPAPGCLGAPASKKRSPTEIIDSCVISLLRSSVDNPAPG